MASKRSKKGKATVDPSASGSPRCAVVRQHEVLAGYLHEWHSGLGEGWLFQYDPDYQGPPVSLTLPVRAEPYEFTAFPPFFEGLLPEGVQLDALLRRRKIDKHDLFRQLVTVGADLVGSVTVAEAQKPYPSPGDTAVASGVDSPD